LVLKARNIGTDIAAAMVATTMVELTLRWPLSLRSPATGTTKVKTIMEVSTIHSVRVVGRPTCVTKKEGSQEYAR
jgi:hypothetical protein